MKLNLFHGRNDPDEEMNDWGFQGPVLGGVEFVHITYTHHIRVGFDDWSTYRRALELTGWDVWDEKDRVLEASIHDDMIVAAGKYYGDWQIEQ